MNEQGVSVDQWRARWRSAAESAFPALVADPTGYVAAVEAIGLIADELRSRDAGLDDLAAAMARPDELWAAVAADTTPPRAPVPLLVGVACSMRERELIAKHGSEERSRVIEEARGAGRAWAVLEGPETVDELEPGPSGVAACVHLHLESGIELHAAIEAWSREGYRVDVVHPDGRACGGQSFTRREDWLAEVGRRHAEIGATTHG